MKATQSGQDPTDKSGQDPTGGCRCGGIENAMEGIAAKLLAGQEVGG